jgi:hypothetical protein
MPDIQYIFKAARKGSNAYAQRRSVLWPLIRRQSLYDETVIEDTERLLAWWRAKLTALHEIGWKDILTTGKSQFARNCPPMFAVGVSDKIARPCKLSQICPWCYSRDTSTLYNLIAEKLPKRGATIKNPLHLLEIRQQWLRTETQTGTMLDCILRTWKMIPRKLLSKINSKGAYYGITLEPRVIEGQSLRWKFVCHILALVDADFEIPSKLITADRQFKLLTVTSRKQLIPIIGRVRRYPVGLMKSDEQYVLMALNARRRIQCKALTGCLRKPSGARDVRDEFGEKENPKVAS